MYSRYMVNFEKQTIDLVTVIARKSDYTIIEKGNELYGIPHEDSNVMLIESYETACSLLYGGHFMPQD